MKQLLLVIGVLMLLVACHIKHDHSKQMPQVRIVADTTQKKDVLAEEEEWAEDPLLEIPDVPEDINGDATPDEIHELEQMMQGKVTE